MKEKTKIILAYIIGAVMFSCISVYATHVIESSDVTYKKQDGTSTTVALALNELYNAHYAETFPLSYSSLEGNRKTGAQTTITLQKGRYIIAANESYVGAASTTMGPSLNRDDMDWISPIVTTTNGVCKHMGSAESSSKPSSELKSGLYVYLNNHYIFYDCILTQTSTITAKENLSVGDSTTVPMNVFIEAIKIE